MDSHHRLRPLLGRRSTLLAELLRHIRTNFQRSRNSFEGILRSVGRDSNPQVHRKGTWVTATRTHQLSNRRIRCLPSSAMIWFRRSSPSLSLRKHGAKRLRDSGIRIRNGFILPLLALIILCVCVIEHFFFFVPLREWDRVESNHRPSAYQTDVLNP